MSQNLEDSKGKNTDANFSSRQGLRQGCLTIVVRILSTVVISTTTWFAIQFYRIPNFWLGFVIAALVFASLELIPKTIRVTVGSALKISQLVFLIGLLSSLFILSILPPEFFIGATLATGISFFMRQINRDWKAMDSLSINPPTSSLNGEAVNSSLNTRHFNPYVVGPPVPPDKFYGRQQMLQKILASIKSGNHVAIYGERRIGKTSLLHRLEHLLKGKTDVIFVPLFIQMQMISEDNFFKALIDAVLKSTPPSVKKSLSLGRETSAQSYEGLDLLSDLETVIKAWRDEIDKQLLLVFLLDEGDCLNRFSEATQMQLRGLLQDAFINQHVRLVWSGVRIERTWQSDTSPWFNLFKAEFHIDSLKPEEARRLILEPVAGVYDYEAEAVARIQELSLNKPYLIQSLCSNLIDDAQERGMTRGCLTLQDVEAIWADIQQKDPSAQLLAYEATQPQVQITESKTKYETSENNSP